MRRFGKQLSLRGYVGAVDGAATSAARSRDASRAEDLGLELAESMLAEGAAAIIRQSGRRLTEPLPLAGRTISSLARAVSPGRWPTPFAAWRHGRRGARDPIEPPPTSALDEALGRLATYDWVVFTSVNGVEAFFDRLSEVSPRLSFFPEVRAIGPATAESLRERGFEAEVVPEKFVAEEVFRAIADRGELGQALSPARRHRPRSAPDLLRSSGAIVDVVVAYRTVPPTKRCDGRRSWSSGARWTWSRSPPPRPRGAFRQGRPRRRRPREAASIGPITSNALRELGVTPTVEAERFTTEGLVEAILRHYRGN
jgi:uroporphyrinogen-III synthase